MIISKLSAWWLVLNFRIISRRCNIIIWSDWRGFRQCSSFSENSISSIYTMINRIIKHQRHDNWHNFPAVGYGDDGFFQDIIYSSICIAGRVGWLVKKTGNPKRRMIVGLQLARWCSDDSASKGGRVNEWKTFFPNHICGNESARSWWKDFMLLWYIILHNSIISQKILSWAHSLHSTLYFRWGIIKTSRDEMKM